MDPVGFLTQTRVLIVAGKGGVGKTTVTAALARAGARAGLRTLVVEVEGRSGLGAMFGRSDPLTYDEVVLAAGRDGAADVRARTLTPDDALLEYLNDRGLSRVSKRLVASGAIDVVATAAPGIKDILVLGKLKQLERSDAADLIVLDAPAAGHAVTFLTSAVALLDAVRVGPIRTQAQDVLDLLSDPARSRVVLVTIPEETPVNEVVETARRLRERVDISLTPVVVNGVYPPLEGLDVDPCAAATQAGVALEPCDAQALRDAAEFRLRRAALQRAQLARLAAALPLPQLQLPFLFRTELGTADLDVLAGALVEQVRVL